MYSYKEHISFSLSLFQRNTSTSMARTFSDSESAAAIPHSAKISCACLASRCASPSLLDGAAPTSHCHHPTPPLPLVVAGTASSFDISFDEDESEGAPPCITTISCCKLLTVDFNSFTSCLAFTRDADAPLACSRALSLSRHALAKAAARASCYVITSHTGKQSPSRVNHGARLYDKVVGK